MKSNSFLRPGLCLAFVLTLAACGHSTQVTSGKDYLSRYDQARGSGSASGEAALDAQVREAANVEPTLRFPARIGIARLRHGQLAPATADEGETWMDLAKRLGPDWGEFVPISPLIAALASQPGDDTAQVDCRIDYQTCLQRTMRDVRLGAARQHVDVVLIYEAFGKSESTSNPIAITKLALIGFFLPSEDVTAKGIAHAVLVDVRNGYTYGMAQAQSGREEFALATSSNQLTVANRLNLQAEAAAVQALAPEVEAMLRDLRLKLAEKRAAEATM